MMDPYARKFITILIISTIALAGFTTICFFLARGMSYLLWRAFYATIFIGILTVVAITKKGNIERKDIWKIILVVVILSLIFFIIIYGDIKAHLFLQEYWPLVISQMKMKTILSHFFNNSKNSSFFNFACLIISNNVPLSISL